MIYYACVGLYTIVAAALVATVVRFYRATRRIHRVDTTTALTDDLPTVSVCIPARNEMYALATCLDRVLASDYPKLEIIVLDDESEDDTSLLIKSYAHAGVRFIAGEPLPEGWLGKNYALDTLLRAASGHYVVFLDVDTHIGYQTISTAVQELKKSKAPLLSTIPHRDDVYRMSALFGSLRYFWTLLISAKFTPASSAFWVVERQPLLDAGGLTGHRLATYPEMSLQTTIGHGRLVDSFGLGVSFEKRWSSQLDTSVRLLKPLLGACMLFVWPLLLLVAALPVVVIDALINQLTGLCVVTAAGVVSACLLLVLFYRVQWSRRWYVAVIIGPLVMLQEAAIVFMSYLRYARGTVTWKGRAIELHGTTTTADADIIR